jgi:hypothetical protein
VTDIRKSDKTAASAGADEDMNGERDYAINCTNECQRVRREREILPPVKFNDLRK